MNIHKTEVKTYMEHVFCDNCGDELVKSDIVLLTNPPKYRYECPNCGHSEDSFEIYPKMSYKEVELYSSRTTKVPRSSKKDAHEKKMESIFSIMDENSKLLFESKTSLPTLTHNSFNDYGYDY